MFQNTHSQRLNPDLCDGDVPAPKGMLWRDQRPPWHTQLRAVVGLVKTVHVINVEERSRYTKVPTEITPGGSRDQQAVAYLETLRNRAGNSVVFFLH